MRLDHVSYAAGPDGLISTAKRIGDLLGEDFVDGGIHPRFGTRNMTLPLAGGTYIEVVEVLDHPASDKAPFGQAVRARSELGGGWMAWVVSTAHIERVEKRLGRPATDGNRHLPDGTELKWKQIGIHELKEDPQLPFFIHWPTFENHPSTGATGNIKIDTLEIGGDPKRVEDWLAQPLDGPLEDVGVEWIAPNGTPGLLAIRFATPNGIVRI